MYALGEIKDTHTNLDSLCMLDIQDGNELYFFQKQILPMSEN